MGFISPSSSGSLENFNNGNSYTSEEGVPDGLGVPGT